MMEHYHTIKPLECTVVGPGVVVKVEEEEIYSAQNNQNPVTNTGGESIKREVDVKAEQSEETCNRRKRKSDRRKRIPESNVGSVDPKPEIAIKTEDDREDSYMRNQEDRNLKTRTGHNLKSEIEVKLEADDQSYAMGDPHLEERDSSPAASPDYFLVQIKEEEEDMSFGMDYQQHGEKVAHPQTSSGYGEAVREKDGRIHRMSSKMFIDIAQLIQLVQERPELYNPKTPSYADRYKKKKAWDEICAIVVPDWELCSEKEKNIKVKTVKTRWRSMKDNYAKELRLQRRERRSGSGVGKRRVYAYFSLLEFLRPVIKLRQADSNMDDLDDQVEEETSCMDDSRSTGSPLIINEEVVSTSSQVTETTETNLASASSADNGGILATPPTRVRDNSPSTNSATTRRILATPPTRAKDNSSSSSIGTSGEILATSPTRAQSNPSLASTASAGRNLATPLTRAQDNSPSANTATTGRNLATPPRRGQGARQPARSEAPRRWAQQPSPIMEEVLHFFIEEAQKQRGAHYNLAMSFIPYLEDIPMERLAAATIDILNVMTAYKEEVPPRPYVAVPQHNMNLPFYPAQQGYPGYANQPQQPGYPGYPHPPQQPEYHSSPQPPQQPGYHGYPPTPPPP